MGEIAAVVVTFNRKTLLITCIESILSQTLKVDTVFIIDNASTDGSFDYFLKCFHLKEGITLLRKEGYRNEYSIKEIDVIYIRTTKNAGGSGGFNLGMRLAYEKHQYIWVMDDDAFPCPDALEYLYKGYKEHPDASFMASNIIDADGIIVNAPAIDSRNSNGKRATWNEFLKSGCVKIISATFVSLLFDRKTIKNIGLPIKEFYIWMDDIEYTLRATKGDREAYLIGGSCVRHKIKGDNYIVSLIEEDRLERFNRYEYLYRNSFFCVKKHGTRKEVIKYFIKIFILGVEILYRSKNYKIIKLKILLKGALRGIFFNPQIEKI